MYLHNYANMFNKSAKFGLNDAVNTRKLYVKEHWLTVKVSRPHFINAQSTTSLMWPRRYCENDHGFCGKCIFHRENAFSTEAMIKVLQQENTATELLILTLNVENFLFLSTVLCKSIINGQIVYAF